MREKAVFRIRIITGLVLLLALALVVRLYFVQVAHGEIYAAQAEGQYVHTVQNVFKRGSILFTTKDNEHVSAAAVRSGYVLAVNPQRINEPEYVYEQLEPFLSVGQPVFVNRATLPGRTYVEIDQTISREDAESIAEIGIPGVMLYRNQWRYYPGNSLSAQTIGFLGHSNEPEEGLRGRYGLEAYYEDVLSRDNESLSVNFFAGIFTNLGSLRTVEPGESEGHVITNLEPTVSRMLDHRLSELHEQYNSSYSGGIIMDPRTGAIKAMSVVPSYDNNDRRNVPMEHFRNPLVQNVYEFGSIVKALTIAAGIDHGAITPNSQYYDTGSITLDRFTIRNYDGRGRGQVDMQQVLSQSLNTGVSHIVDLMGTSNFRRYFLDLGLATTTNVDLPNEALGLVENLNSPRKVEYATASFGQGIAVTPMAMIRALAALGNGGYLVTPHIAKGIEYEDGSYQDFTPPRGPQVLSSATSETISRMLTTVVDDALRGGGVALPHHTIGAKTGTAQIPNPSGRGYLEDSFLHSFFGYFPAYDPQFIVLLYTIEPQGVRFASETLTDPFMDIATYLINYYEIAPDR